MTTVEEAVDQALDRERGELRERIEEEDRRRLEACAAWDAAWDEYLAAEKRGDEAAATRAYRRADGAQARATGAAASGRRLREQLDRLENPHERERRVERRLELSALRERQREADERARANGQVPPSVLNRRAKPRKTDRGAGVPGGPETDDERALCALDRASLRALAKGADVGVGGHKIVLVRRLLAAGVKPPTAAAA